jgi:hypothetical protein
MPVKKSTPIPEHEIKSVSEFVDRIEKIKDKQLARRPPNESDLLFRGQPCDKPLRPKFGRVEAKGERRKIERLILDKFNRAHPPFSEFEPEDEWDLLALAQHHHLVTRLLDWTRSAPAALWFAVREPARQKEDGKGFENGVVWVLCALVKDYLQAEDIKRYRPLDNRLATRIFRPKAISRRIVAQSGVFTIHKLIGGKDFTALEDDPRYENKLEKIIIPRAAFPSIRKALDMFNANASVLLPDLDGLGCYLSWRYTKLEDET